MYTFTLVDLEYVYTKLVHNQKEVVSKLHVCTNGIVKIYASYIFQFSTRIPTSTH